MGDGNGVLQIGGTASSQVGSLLINNGGPVSSLIYTQSAGQLYTLNLSGSTHTTSIELVPPPATQSSLKISATEGGPFTIIAKTSNVNHTAMSINAAGAVTLPISPLTIDATDGSNLAIQVEAPANGATFSYTGSNSQVNELLLGGNTTSTAAVINSSQNGGAISLEIIANDGGPWTMGAAEWTPQVQISVASNGVVSFPGNTAGTLTALMPAATLANTLAVYNGTNWVIVNPPATTGTFALQVVNNVIGWH